MADTPSKTDPAADHGAADCYMDNIGEGWRIECLCGWTSIPNPTMQSSGEEFDEHLKTLYPNYPNRRAA
jgi:hypothetical protein